MTTIEFPRAARSPRSVAVCPRTWLVFLSLTASAQSWALPPEKGMQAVSAARTLLGSPYVFGGRSVKGDGGVDCLAVVFAALEAVSGCGWRSFSVSMTDSLTRAELGEPLAGFAPVRSDKLDVRALEPGDVLLLAGEFNNPAEPAAATVDGRSLKDGPKPKKCRKLGVPLATGKSLAGR